MHIFETVYTLETIVKDETTNTNYLTLNLYA